MEKIVFIVFISLFFNCLYGQQLSKEVKSRLFTENDVNKITYLWDGKHYKIRNSKYQNGITDDTGNIIIDIKYDNVHSSGANGWIVLDNENYFYVDITGKALNSERYDEANTFKNGVARIKRNGKMGMIDTAGKTVIPINYDEIKEVHRFEDVFVVKQNDKYGVINSNHETLVPLMYSYISSYYNGLFAVNLDGEIQENGSVSGGKWGYINLKNEIIIPLEYEMASPFSGLGNDMAPVKTNGKFGFINTKGEKVIPFEYDDAGKFSDEFTEDPDTSDSKFLAPVKKGEKWGYIDEKNNLIIPFQFDDAGFFLEWRAYVTVDKESFHINGKGQRTD